MGLKFFQTSSTIPFAGGQGEISVRGLSLPEITSIVDTHKADAVVLFDRFTGRDPSTFTSDDAASVASDVLVKFPSIVCHVVAVGADATDRFEDVKRLPPDVLLAAVEEIALHTFSMSGGFENFLDLVIRIAQSGNALSDHVKGLRSRLPSTSGSGGSAPS